MEHEAACGVELVYSVRSSIPFLNANEQCASSVILSTVLTHNNGIGAR